MGEGTILFISIRKLDQDNKIHIPLSLPPENHSKCQERHLFHRVILETINISTRRTEIVECSWEIKSKQEWFDKNRGKPQPVKKVQEENV